MKPRLYIDVDGPLNPYAAKPSRRPPGYETHRLRPTGWEKYKPLRVWLNPSHGPLLLSLPFELVWATTWVEDANRLIGPRIGLPQLEVVQWSPGKPYRDDGTYFKTHDVVAHAAGRPFAWIDDETRSVDQEYVDRTAPGGYLRWIDPKVGFTAHDAHALQEWARSFAA